MADFDAVLTGYIEKLDLWASTGEVIRKVYADVLADENSFCFMTGILPRASRHGGVFQHLLAVRHDSQPSIITNEDERGKGCGVKSWTTPRNGRR